MLPGFRFMFTSFTAAKFVYEVYEIVSLQASYLEATECEKELVQTTELRIFLD